MLQNGLNFNKDLEEKDFFRTKVTFGQSKHFVQSHSDLIFPALSSPSSPHVTITCHSLPSSPLSTTPNSPSSPLSICPKHPISPLTTAPITTTSSVTLPRLLLCSASPLLKSLLLQEVEDTPLIILLTPGYPLDLRHLETFLKTGFVCCSSTQQLARLQDLLAALDIVPSVQKNTKDVFDVKTETYEDPSNKRGNVIAANGSGDWEADEDLKEETWEEGDEPHGLKSPTAEYQTKKFGNQHFSKPGRKTIGRRKKESVQDSKTDQKKAVCEVCGGHYKDKDSLRVHVRTQHTGAEDRPFSCDVCGAGFKTKGSLTIHASKHAQERAFVCDECGFQTKNKWLLKAHIKTHKIVKDFSCPHCPKTFNFQFILDKHVRVHTGERPFPCNTCGSSFVSGIHLRRHEKSVHKAVRDFVCQICAAPFKRMSELKRHVILHSGERPFSCVLCGETFRHREAGRRHCRSVHQGVEGAKVSYKPSQAIGELSSFAAKRLTPEELEERRGGGRSNIPELMSLT